MNNQNSRFTLQFLGHDYLFISSCRLEMRQCFMYIFTFRGLFREMEDNFRWLTAKR